MYCNNCGEEIRDGAAFCNHCGAKANNRSKSNAVIKNINDYAEIVVPKALLDKFPKLNALAFVCIFVAFVFVVIMTVTIVTHGGHNLEGTYRCNEDMMFTSFTFSKDGTVTATYDYCSNDNMYGAVYTGKYKKSGGKYIIHLTDNNISGGSSITQFYNDNVDELYDIKAKKNGDNSLEISIGGKISYLENYATYYKSY